MNSDMHRELQESIDLLRGQFDELSSGIRLPHSLDADVLREQLNHVVPFPTSTPRKHRWRAGVEHCGLFRFDVGRGCDAVKSRAETSCRARPHRKAPVRRLPTARGRHV